MIKAIVFDCYGVLVGHGFWATYRHAGGDPVKDAEFIRYMLRMANTGQVSKEDFAAEIAKQIGISVEKWLEATAYTEVPNDEMLEYIRAELKPHYKLGIVSNANVGSLERRLPPDRLALFDVKIVSAEVGFLKPQPEIFKLAAERLGVTFEEMVFVDDLERYAKAAADLGIHSIQFKEFETFKTQLENVLEQ